MTEISLASIIQGDQTDSTIRTEGASCGGGERPSDVYRFTASEAGPYHFISMNDSGGSGTVIYLRSSCSDVLSEVGCGSNDNGVEANLEIGETIYIFVESLNPMRTHPYTLTAGSGNLP